MAGNDVSRVLYTGYKVADVTRDMVSQGAVFHVLDIYHAHAFGKVFPEAEVVCSADLPEGPWDTVRFRTGPKLCSGELSLDLLQQAHSFGCHVELDYVGRERDRNDLVAKIRDDPSRKRSFRAQWPASVPGGPKLEFCSYPGCFCHRRLDEGGLALAEVVCRELAPRRADQFSFLDMGCGSGLVGFLVKSVLPGAVLTMVDSHTRAIKAAGENAQRFSMPAQLVLSDNGVEGGQFDVFAGNPPYYSDYRIADVFLETALGALRPGGLCYTVCKNAKGLEPVQRRYFGEVRVVPRRGYSVLCSVKQPGGV